MIRSFEDLIGERTGVLWAINRYLFHPRGFALALHKNEENEIIGWSLLGDGREVWTFSAEDDDECFNSFEGFLMDTTIKNTEDLKDASNE